MKNFKSLLSVILAVMMVASMIVLPVSAADADTWDGTADTSWYNASASEFELTTAEQLAGLAALVNEGTTFKGKTVKLGADIQLQDTVDPSTYATWGTAPTGIRVWTCIGGYNVGSFQGTFDGQNHTISGMYAPKAADPGEGTRSAFFGYVIGATIKDVSFVNCYASNTACTAIVVGFNATTAPTLTNVDVSASKVVGGNDGSALLVGKTGGFNKFEITDCDVSGTVDATCYAGGLLGYLSGGTSNDLKFENCVVDVTVTGSGYYRTDTTKTGANIGGIGGLVGIIGRSGASCTLKDFDVVDCDITVDVTGTVAVGGIVGYIPAKTEAANVTDSKVNATVDCTYYGSGMFGYLEGNVVDVTVEGCEVDITGTANGMGNSRSYDDACYSAFGGFIGMIGSASQNGSYRKPADCSLGNISFLNNTVTADITAPRSSAALLGYVLVNSINEILIDGNTVDADVKTNAAKNGNINASDMGILMAYIRTNGFTKGITVKNCDISGSLNTCQNSGVILGRYNKSTAAGAFDTFTVNNVTSDVVVTTDKYYTEANPQCLGAVIGLPQEKITTINVSEYRSTNTFKAYDSAAIAPADCGGLIGSGIVVTVNVSDSVLDDEITGRTAIGGVFGNFKGETFNATNCVVKSDLSGTEYVGGFVGDTNTNAKTYAKCYFTFDACIFEGSVEASTRNAGGFIGDYDTSSGTQVAGTTNHCGEFTFRNCIVDAPITTGTAGNSNAGGLIGRIYPPNGKIVVENVVLAGTREGTNVGVLVGTYGGANSMANLVTLDNLYFSNGSVTEFFGVEGTVEGVNIYAADNTCYTSETREEFEANLLASGEWELGDDGELYPVGINFPGHEHIWGVWVPNDDGITETHYCEVFECDASETQDCPVECTCRNRADWTAWRVITVATCTENGLSFRTCRGCGVVEYATVAAGHKWGEWTVSCTDDHDLDGYANMTRVCYGTCGGVETGSLVAVSHSGTWTVMSAPTATVPGAEALICDDCGQTLDTRTIPALGVTPVAPVTPVTPVTPTYTDISGHKYADDIMFVTEYGLFNGMGDDKFQPETTMTRGMLVTVLARLAKVNVTAYTNNFTDVAADSYYAPYVGWAEAAEITNGFGDGTFRPNDEITKEQAIAMIARYLTFIDNKDNTTSYNAEFTDMDSVSEWAEDYVDELIRLGIVEADATTLRPTDDATRAELANYFANLVKYLTR